jgi:ParB family chromosome partitioning protein
MSGSEQGLRLEAFTDLLPGAREAQRIVEIDLDQLSPSPVQVRAPFDPRNREDDAGLVASIRQDGVIQPLLVVLSPQGGPYRVVDGHRRWAAARAAGLSTVPCIVLTLDEVEAAFRTGVSNLQRRDLTPLEEGQQYVELMRIGGLSARELAQRLGKPPRTVQRRVALTSLPSRVQELLEQGRLSPNQALGCHHEAWGPALAEMAAERGLSRETIDRVAEYLVDHPGSTPREALERVGEDGRPGVARRRRRPRQEKPRPEVDYDGLVADLDVPLTPEQRGLLAEYARMERLDGVALRWAALVLAGVPTMTAAGAVAYAQQLAGTPIGKALRAIGHGLETLERRVRKARLTPNLIVATRAVVGDVVRRLDAVASGVEQAPAAVTALPEQPAEVEEV